MGSQQEGLVSVIIPTYNRADIIGKDIASVMGQSYDSWELLVVDDGSTDNTVEVVTGFKDSRVRYFSYGDNHGGNFARNYGMAKVRGEFIAFLDSDNEWDKDFLFEHVRALRELCADIVFCRYEVIPYNANKIIHAPALEDYDSEPKVQLLNTARLCRDMLQKNRFDTNTACLR